MDLLNTLDSKHKEQMVCLLSRYFWKEHKNVSEYTCFTVDEMFERLSDKSKSEWYYQLHKCIDMTRFLNLVDYTNKLIKQNNQ